MYASGLTVKDVDYSKDKEDKSQEYEAVRLFCQRVMLAKKQTERKRKRNSRPCRITRWRGMAVRRPRAASSPSQRTATKRRDGAKGNAPLSSAKLNS